METKSPRVVGHIDLDKRISFSKLSFNDKNLMLFALVYFIKHRGAKHYVNGYTIAYFGYDRWYVLNLNRRQINISVNLQWGLNELVDEINKTFINPDPVVCSICGCKQSQLSYSYCFCEI